jgi:hypothetical protein
MPATTEPRDAGQVQVPAGPRIIEERPPPGLARGKYVWPAWSIGLLGGIVVLLGITWIVWRLRRGSRRR